MGTGSRDTYRQMVLLGQVLAMETEEEKSDAWSDHYP